MMPSVTSQQVLLGVALTVTLAVGSQVVAQRLRIPALILLLPLGFLAGAATDLVHPEQLLGPAFQPLVGLAVALILYDAGLGLDLGQLTGHPRRVVFRLIAIGVPITVLAAAWAASLLLQLSSGAALMLGAILVVSGPTVVGPVLAAMRPLDRPQRILAWEGSLIDPIGAILGAIVLSAVAAETRTGHGRQVAEFALSLGVGLAGGLVGLALLWLLLLRLQLGEVLGTAAQVAVVVAVAAVCDAIRDDAGLLAAILMGLAVANLRGFEVSARRPFFEVLVQLTLGLLFISISATVTPASLRHLIGPTLALAAVLVVIVRPIVALLSTWRTELGRGERELIAWMAPRGIVAASTASTFGATLAMKGIPGASKILPATFLVIVVTVTLYGLTGAPVARRLGVVREARTRPLLVGGSPWVVDFARALRTAGLDVLLWAAQPDERDRAQAAGVTLARGDEVAAAVGRGVRIDGVTMVLLLSDEDDFNALAITLLEDTVDGGVLRVRPPGPAHGVVAAYTGAGLLFADGMTTLVLRRRYEGGSRIIVRPAVTGVPAGHDLLCVVDADGQLFPAVSPDEPVPEPTDTLVLLSP
jgi:NhaP-type Na+/H+ or K+/H+ antiporter